MPGTITKIYHKPGDILKKGQSIISMEAMKMELVIKADFDCKIIKINVKEN
jgi:biotin carboxyl carrier protein